ncbi:type III CRISPR-associated RAMP protein Csx7 [Haliangium ochraceum]|uniref:CRISPR-associated RAMP protein, SSO1426 family n=1 Tax=Haliangium ochraceum (strain DSM 14365 / JCM 11303 / SMP-2) TaxID=502025 RepID=D0LG43_HALO1|nr:CRISPR-associated RAMP protein Csx7 [Haliangium ochraceum]ACY18068.1 CRISPR-associated RAMP protein, SSO1426 family [Haliangium ochraceum DSM 14365]
MAERVADFHSLRERLRLQGKLSTRTALRVGSSAGGDFDTADLPIMRDADGRPFLPGASLKGVVRSTVEALLRGASGPARREADLWACDPFAMERDAKQHACGYHEPGRRKHHNTEQHCAACRLFGSHLVASHARFCDALLVSSERRIPIETRDGVAIDRDLGTVHGGKKYDFEVVSPGASFAIEVFVDNPTDWLLGLLVMGFDQLSEGFSALGGFTSRGLGRVELSWSSLTRIDAATLLEGGDATCSEGEKLTDTMSGWRTALAERAGLAAAASAQEGAS